MSIWHWYICGLYDSYFDITNVWSILESALLKAYFTRGSDFALAYCVLFKLAEKFCSYERANLM